MRFAGPWLLALVCFVPATTATADPRSDEVLKRFREVTKATRSLQAEMVMTTQSAGDVRTLNYAVRLMRPNFAQIRVTGAKGEKQSAFMSDGTNLFVITDEVKRYHTTPVSPNGENIGGAGNLHSPVAAFFLPERFLRGTTHRFVGQQNTGGKVLTCIEVASQRAPQSQRFYFNPAGHLEGIEQRYSDAKGARVVSTSLKNLRVGGELDPATFAYSPPVGYRPYKMLTFEERLIAVGTPAPDFSAQNVDSGTVTLSDARKGKKATLVYFWFQGAPASVRELGELQKLYAELQPRGFEVIGVNWNNPAETVRRIAAEHKVSFPMTLSGETEKVSQAYRVLSYPTYYLLDQEGKIAWRATGVDGAELRKQLGKLGL